MISIEPYFEKDPFSFFRAEKRKLLSKTLYELTKHHYEHCLSYRNMLDANVFSMESQASYEIEQIPFLPVRLFKELELRSIEPEEIVKTMTSSGTTGQAVSKIFLDKQTAANQQKALAKTVSSFLGSKRLPMIIIDSPSVIKNRAMFSARGAGILGFSLFGRDKVYAFDEEMQLNENALNEFLEKHQDEKIFCFGFTFMIWQYFYKVLQESNRKIDLSKAILIHGGGWKKLKDEAVTPAEFKERLKDVCGIERVHDYYGMVEQTGSIYMECECGHLHAPVFSDIIIRRPIDFSVAEKGEKGIIEVLSVLPTSYPGHGLLTEDEGILLGEDDCPCKRAGKYFTVTGRLARAEIRGCSDTYAKPV